MVRSMADGTKTGLMHRSKRSKRWNGKNPAKTSAYQVFQAFQAFLCTQRDEPDSRGMMTPLLAKNLKTVGTLGTHPKSA